MSLGIAALAYGAIHDGLICYESVVTDPSRQRRGYARRVISSLAGWAADRGAQGACLEVEAANAPARALYEALGFEELYRYHYRRAPPLRRPVDNVTAALSAGRAVGMWQKRERSAPVGRTIRRLLLS